MLIIGTDWGGGGGEGAGCGWVENRARLKERALLVHRAGARSLG